MTIITRAYKDFIIHEREVALYFDLTILEKNFAFLKSLSNEKTKFLFPVKSFPTREVLEMAGRYSDGFDLSNQAEYLLCRDFIHEDSLLWSSAPFVWDYQGTHRLVYDVQNPERETPSRSLKSLRVSSDFLNDPQRSRFGWDTNFLEKVSLHTQGIDAIHVHHGNQYMSKDIYFVLITRLGEILQGHPEIRYVNFGGGFVHLSEEDVREVVKHAQMTFPRTTLVFEPGRWLSREAGYCMGRIKEIIQREDMTYLITSISRDCHLKWMNTKLQLEFIEGGGKRMPCSHVTITGPTCYEGDRICEMDQLNRELGTEDCLVIRGVSGYSVAWNSSFNGVAAAPVLYLKS